MDVTYKICVVVLSFTNLLTTIYLFWTKTGLDTDEKEKDRKIQGIKALILDYRMKDYFELFKSIANDLQKYNLSKKTIGQKIKLNSSLLTFLSELRINFIDNFIAIDNSLYKKLLIMADSAFDKVSEMISEEENAVKSVGEMEKVFLRLRTDIIGEIYSFRGK
ncbi:hypothetical protein [Leptospira neocaledonica]|uniref:hypothetical protein n=1 Tax=Leptospira neocaledonica TaxID=2023192 RepID=UPI000F6456E0|nr:hypothetical protein [Leptospira neocaledonica]